MTFGEILQVLLVGYPVDPEFVNPDYPAFLQQLGGLSLTLVVTVLGLMFGFPLGLALGLARHKRSGPTAQIGRAALRYGSAACIELLRGMPVMVLVLLIFYLPFPLFGLRIPPVILAVVVFSLYSGVYMSEVVRSGLRAVDERWIDAARVLGMGKWQTLLSLRLPIALRAMLPAFIGLAITVFKDTSVLVVVAVPEMMYSARQVQAGQPVNHALILGMVLLIYWGVATVGAGACRRLETASNRNSPGRLSTSA